MGGSSNSNWQWSCNKFTLNGKEHKAEKKGKKGRREWVESDGHGQLLENKEWETEKKVVKGAKLIKIKDWQRDNPKPKKKDAKFTPEPAIPKPKLKRVDDIVLEDDAGDDCIPDLWTDDEASDEDKLLSRSVTFHVTLYK
ncbi:hypothetical protein BYT27DRAFT_7212611 [Phlegmacium glaucopus]|nr:hypothetical protein BYT27DRAFT_7212611 [Phlegmacium glaucopus]